MEQKNKLLEWLQKKAKNEKTQDKKDINITAKDKEDNDTIQTASISPTTSSHKEKTFNETLDMIHEEEKEELSLEEEPIINELSNEDITKNTVIDDITIKNDALAEIEKMLRSDQYEIEYIKYELDTIKKEEEKEQALEEVQKLIDRLNALIKKFEKIKNDFFTKYYDEIEINSNSDNYIKHLIEEYKTALKTDRIKDATILEIKQIEEYISVINEIIELENDTSKLNDTLENKEENIIEINKDFDKSDDDYKKIDKINDYIDKFAREQNSIITDIEKKVSNQESVTKIVEYQSEIVTNYTQSFASILAMAASSLIPPTKTGNILKTALMAGAIAGIVKSRKLVMKESKVTTITNYIDYEKEILNSINNVNDVSLTVDATLLNIKDLKKDLEHDFKDYSDSIPNFYNMMVKLDSIEKDLIVKSQIIKDFDKKLEKIKKENNNKIKKIEIDYLK